MMKVPMDDRQVQVTPTLMPTPQISKAIPGAFGEDVAVATENLGKAGMKISNEITQHLQKRIDFANKSKVYELETKFDADLMNKLTNTEEETYSLTDSTGKVTEYTRPVGLLNQTGDYAHEASARFNEFALPLINQYVSQIKDPEYQLQLRQSLETQYRTRYNSVINHETEQTNQANKDRIDAKLQTQANLFPTATIEDKPKIISDAHKAIAAGYERGLFTYDQAQKRIQDFDSTIVKTDIYNDNSTQEEQSKVLAELKKGDKGDYFFLPQDERLKMIEESQRRIFQNNQTFKREAEISQNQRNDNIIQKIVDGSITLKDIESEMTVPEEAGGVKKSILKTYYNGVQGRIAKDLNVMLKEETADKEPTIRAKKVSQYLDLINNYIDDKTDMWIAKEQLANAWKDGVINGEEAKVLNPLKHSLENIAHNREGKPNVIQNFVWDRNPGLVIIAIKALKSKLQNFNATDEELAINIKRLLGTTPDENTSNLLIKEHVKSKIPVLSEKGEEQIDKKGNRFVVFPDGTIEESEGSKYMKAMEHK